MEDRFYFDFTEADDAAPEARRDPLRDDHAAAVALGACELLDLRLSQRHEFACALVRASSDARGIPDAGRVLSQHAATDLFSRFGVVVHAFVVAPVAARPVRARLVAIVADKIRPSADLAAIAEGRHSVTVLDGSGRFPYSVDQEGGFRRHREMKRPASSLVGLERESNDFTALRKSLVRPDVRHRAKASAGRQSEISDFDVLDRAVAVAPVDEDPGLMKHFTV